MKPMAKIQNWFENIIIARRRAQHDAQAQVQAQTLTHSENESPPRSDMLPHIDIPAHTFGRHLTLSPFPYDKTIEAVNNLLDQVLEADSAESSVQRRWIGLFDSLFTFSRDIKRRLNASIGVEESAGFRKGEYAEDRGDYDVCKVCLYSHRPPSIRLQSPC